MPRGNPAQFKEKNQLQRESTLNLIRNTVELMNEMGEILEVKNVSEKTKEIDPRGKGVSVASFRNKKLEHIQKIMAELRIGKFKNLKISENLNEINLEEQILQMQKEINKLEKVISKKDGRINDLKKKLEDKVIDNEELRVRIYEMEMKNKIKAPFIQANN